MGRHNLHTEFIEGILDVLMQLRIKARHIIRRGDISIQFIVYIEIVQRTLQHEWRRFAQHLVRPFGSQQQQLMHLPPGRIVADSDAGGENQLPFAGRKAVIDHLVVHQHGIGNGYFHILRRAQARHQQRSGPPSRLQKRQSPLH